MTASSHSRHSINLLRNHDRGDPDSGLSVEVRSAARTVVCNQLHDRRAALTAEAPCGNPTACTVAIVVIKSRSTTTARRDFGIICRLWRSLDVFEITHHRVVITWRASAASDRRANDMDKDRLTDIRFGPFCLTVCASAPRDEVFIGMTEFYRTLPTIHYL
jgi:hypothetical protein